MGINSIFKRLHNYGQDLLFDRVHNKLKVVIEDGNKNRFLANGLLSRYSDNDKGANNQNSIITNIFDINKVIVKFRLRELENLKDIKTNSIKLIYDDIRTVIVDGLRYNVVKWEINNHTRDYLILELTKYKN